MGRINASRMIVGGLLAGLVINIGEFLLNGPVVGDEFEAMMADFGMEPMTNGDIGVFVVMAFLMGIVAVWMYAAMRPRYGAGPQTAIRAGLAAWFFGILGPAVGYQVMGMSTMGLTMIVLVWGLIEFPLATAVGAGYYREDDTAEAAAGASAASTPHAVPAGGSGSGSGDTGAGGGAMGGGMSGGGGSADAGGTTGGGGEFDY